MARVWNHVYLRLQCCKLPVILCRFPGTLVNLIPLKLSWFSSLLAEYSVKVLSYKVVLFPLRKIIKKWAFWNTTKELRAVSLFSHRCWFRCKWFSCNLMEVDWFPFFLRHENHNFSTQLACKLDHFHATQMNFCSIKSAWRWTYFLVNSACSSHIFYAILEFFGAGKIYQWKNKIVHEMLTWWNEKSQEKPIPWHDGNFHRDEIFSTSVQNAKACEVLSHRWTELEFKANKRH